LAIFGTDAIEPEGINGITAECCEIIIDNGYRINITKKGPTAHSDDGK